MLHRKGPEGSTLAQQDVFDLPTRAGGTAVLLGKHDLAAVATLAGDQLGTLGRPAEEAVLDGNLLGRHERNR